MAPLPFEALGRPALVEESLELVVKPGLTDRESFVQPYLDAKVLLMFCQISA